MRYRLRDDVVLKEVGGEYVLVALRTAWDEVPFARSIPKRHVYMLECLEKGYSDEEMLEGLEFSRYLSRERAIQFYHAIKDGRLYHGYLVEEKE